MTAPTLDLERLADLVVARLVAALPVAESARLLNAAEAAEWLGVTPDTVRQNAEALGVIRIGDGERPRLRFSVQRMMRSLGVREGLGCPSCTSTCAAVSPDGLLWHCFECGAGGAIDS